MLFGGTAPMIGTYLAYYGLLWVGIYVTIISLISFIVLIILSQNHTIHTNSHKPTKYIYVNTSDS